MDAYAWCRCCGTGSDFAGTVSECGPPKQEGIAALPSEPQAGEPQAGDAVMGLASGCLGTSVVANRAAVARVAPGLALAAAAALPTVVVTAQAAFALAGVRRGMR